MTICIETYFKGMEWGSLRIEDCHLIGKDGARRMTTYNDKAVPKIFKQGRQNKVKRIDGAE